MTLIGVFVRHLILITIEFRRTEDRTILARLLLIKREEMNVTDLTWSKNYFSVCFPRTFAHS